MVGVVDITGPARTFHPTTLALVSAAAKLAESTSRRGSRCATSDFRPGTCRT